MAVDMEDFDAFMARVNEVDSTIKGLASGDIDPDSIDTTEMKIAKIAADNEAKKEKKKKKFNDEVAEKKKAEDDRKLYIEENYDELMAKVETMKEERAMKEDARKKFAKWRTKHEKSGVTDYTGWDLWEPDEDPEDDPLYKDMPPPDTPELRAFEKDIEERAKRRKGKYILAEKEKDNGNEAFRAGQYSEALKCYETAITYKKDSRVLFVNRAFAHVKLGNWASAIEDCDKSIYIGELFENDPKDTITAKALMRRAMAHRGRVDYATALDDLNEALDMAPTNKQIKKLIKAVQADLEEQQKENRVKEELEAAQCPESEDAPTATVAAAPAAAGDIKAGVEALRAPATPEERQAQLDALGAALANEDCLIVARDCGVIAAVCGVVENRGDRQPFTVVKAGLRLALKLALNDRNLKQMIGRKAFVNACVTWGAPGVEERVREDSMELLSLGSFTEEGRAVFVKDVEASESVLENCVQVLKPVTPLVREKGKKAKAKAKGKRSSTRLEVHAAGVVANCSTEAPFRKVIKAHGCAAPLIDALTAQALSPFVDVARKATCALANIASDSVLRGMIVSEPRLQLLLAALRSDLSADAGGAGAGAGIDEVIVNTLGVLANVALEPAAQELLVGKLKALPVLASLLGRAGDVAQQTRATMVMGRCAKQPGAPATITQLGVPQRLAALLLPHVETATAVALKEADSCASLKFVEAAARLFVLCVTAKGSGAAVALRCAKCPGAAKDRGLALLVTMLGVPHGTVAGNTALCIANCAVHDTDPSCLQHFSDADTVKHLCTLAHKAEEAHVRKNAGIALARLAKHPDMIERMRECHGFEIIHTYVKP